MRIEIYELRPTREQGQESFYGKALVYVDEDGTETLYSYNTPIISRKPNGQLKRLWFKVFSNNRETYQSLLWFK